MIEAASSGKATVEIFPDPSALEAAAASFIAAKLDRALATQQTASIIVTGGSTPGGIYGKLSRATLDWKRVEITLSDERWADPLSPASNEHLVRTRLLQNNAANARFIPLMSAEPGPETGAAVAERRLAAMRWPMDLVLLGMGADGHFASLFPHSPVLQAGFDSRDRCIAVPAGSPAPAESRLSLTLRALLDSRIIVIVAIGKTKRQAFEHALAGGDFRSIPVAVLLRQNNIPVHFLWAP